MVKEAVTDKIGLANAVVQASPKSKVNVLVRGPAIQL